MDAILGFKVACDAAQAIQRIAGAVHGVGGFLHPMEGFALYWLAKHWPLEGAVVEIGSFKGLSTSWLAHGCKEGKRARSRPSTIFPEALNIKPDNPTKTRTSSKKGQRYLPSRPISTSSRFRIM